MEIKELGEYLAIPLLFDCIKDKVVLENPDTLQKVDFNLYGLQYLPARELEDNIFQVLVGDSHGNGKIWMNAEKRLFKPSKLFEFELIYGTLQFVTDNHIIVDRLDGFEFASKCRIMEIEDKVNESALAGGYDSYAYRLINMPKTTLYFFNYTDLTNFEEFHSNQFICKIINELPW